MRAVFLEKNRIRLESTMHPEFEGQILTRQRQSILSGSILIENEPSTACLVFWAITL